MTWNDVIFTFGRRDVLLIVGLATISVLLWNIPIINIAFIPFRAFNTIIHELGHVIAARMTGGMFKRFVVFPLGGGATPVQGGVSWIVFGVGYLGATLFGSLLILLTTSSIPARATLMGLGMLLGLICILFAGNAFGFLIGLFDAALLFYAGSQLDDESAATILLFLAVQMIVASFRSLFIQLQISRRGMGRSDAEMMQQFTAIPAIIWALLWCLISLAFLVWSITVAYRDLPLR